MKYNLNNLPNFGVLEVKLNQEQIDLLYKLINHAGGKYGWKIDDREVIEQGKNNQFSLIDNDNIFENEVLKPAVNEYIKNWGWPMNLKTTHYHDLDFNRFWTRITKGDQYQSLHDHQGVFSFTIWLKIPTDWKDEVKDGREFEHPEATDFVLTYTDVMGTIRKFNYKLCPDMEGTMIVFPSDLNHMVLPSWTSLDKFRISVAGDVSLNSMFPGEKLQ